MPMVSVSAEPEDSWHMLEQSGRLLVPQPAHQQLVQERRLVGGPAGGVEDGLVRVVQRAQLFGDDLERLVPADRDVVRGAGVQQHGFGQPALLAQPVIVPFAQLGHRMPGEERRRHPPPGGLLGHGLGAVLAELRGVPLLLLRPGTAGAVETVLLVDLQQRLRGPDRSHLLHGDVQCVRHGRNAHGPGFGAPHFQGCLVYVLHRCLAGH